MGSREGVFVFFFFNILSQTKSPFHDEASVRYVKLRHIFHLNNGSFMLEKEARV